MDEIGILIGQIEEAYRLKAWHGPNLRGSIRGLSPEEASWRPAPDRHCIWEIVVHCAYWKYIVRRRILGEKRGSFPLEGSNWFRRPVGAPESASWKKDVALLGSMHAGLVEAVRSLRPSDLKKLPRGSKFDMRSTVAGIAFHDVYHAGQIQMLKRLQK